jgi:hypothetical protein
MGPDYSGRTGATLNPIQVRALHVCRAAGRVVHDQGTVTGEPGGPDQETGQSPEVLMSRDDESLDHQVQVRILVRQPCQFGRTGSHLVGLGAVYAR